MQQPDLMAEVSCLIPQPECGYQNRFFAGGFPVLLLHGLFQSSGSFVTSEDRSLAFWLAKNGGYQVYLGNTRGVFDMGHRNFKRNDPRFWGRSVCLAQAWR